MLLYCLVLSVLGVVCYFVHRLCSSSLLAPKVESIDITRFPRKYDPATEVSAGAEAHGQLQSNLTADPIFFLLHAWYSCVCRIRITTML